MLLGRRGPAPGLAVTGDHAAREDVEDRIVLDRAHKVGRLHDLVGGVQAPGRPRVRQSYLQDQQAERVSPLGPSQSHPSRSLPPRAFELFTISRSGAREKDRWHQRDDEEERGCRRGKWNEEIGCAALSLS